MRFQQEFSTNAGEISIVANDYFLQTVKVEVLTYATQHLQLSLTVAGGLINEEMISTLLVKGCSNITAPLSTSMNSACEIYILEVWRA